MKDDIFFMSRAIKLAKKGKLTTSPNPNVGCVIVKDNNIIGEGYHSYKGGLHAEIKALKLAGKKAKNSTVYVTLEPCNHYGETPPCTTALIKSGISKLVSCIKDPNPKVSGKGFKILKKSGIKIIKNIMKKESKLINLGYFKRMKTGLPWTTLKLASSIDGRIAMKSGESKWITSYESRQDVQNLRLKNNAILSSSKSILNDNSLLNVRWSQLPKKIKKKYNKKNIIQPIRIILDRKNKILPNHKIIKEKIGNKIWIFKFKKDKFVWPNHVLNIILKNKKKKNKFFNLKLILKEIGKRNINKLLIETGSLLSSSFINSKLIDELIIYIAPKILGSNAKPLFFLPEIKKLINTPKFNFTNIYKIKNDIKLILKPILK